MAPPSTAAALRSALPALRRRRFLAHGVRRKDCGILRETLDVPGLRMTGCEGVLEPMSPSPDHEDRKKTIARLVEVWALEREVARDGHGDAPFGEEAARRGAGGGRGPPCPGKGKLRWSGKASTPQTRRSRAHC